MRRKILITELVGIAVIAILGSLLHFVFEWSGGLKPVALVAAVNESVWEHLKLAFWPMLFFGIYEYFAFGRRKASFFTAKAVAIYTVPILITAIFYAYTAIVGESILAVDILSFVVAIAIGQLISYKLLVTPGLSYKVVPIIMIVLAVIAFSVFSYFPLTNPLFLDPVTGGYGIVEHGGH